MTVRPRRADLRSTHRFPLGTWIVLALLGVLVLTQAPAFLAAGRQNGLALGSGLLYLQRGLPALGWARGEATGTAGHYPYVTRREELVLGFSRVVWERARWADLAETRGRAFEPGHSSVEQVAALRLLGRIRDTASTERVIGALDERRPDVRAAAAEALGWIGGATAAAAIERALEDRDEGVREAAALAAAWAGVRTATAALVRLCDETNPLLRAAAAFALGAVAPDLPRLRDLLRDEHPLVRGRAGVALLGRYPPAESVLARLAGEPNLVAAVYALDALAERRDARAANVLAEALAHPAADVRVRAAKELVDWPGAAVGATLARVPPSDDAYKTALAARAVRGDAAAHAALLTEATGPSPRPALKALARMHDPLVLERLRAGTGEDDWLCVLAEEALDAPRQLPRELLEALVGARSREAPYAASRVRALACEALGLVGEADSLSVLESALADEAWEVRVFAAEAMGRIAGQPWERSVPGVAQAARWLEARNAPNP